MKVLSVSGRGSKTCSVVSVRQFLGGEACLFVIRIGRLQVQGAVDQTFGVQVGVQAQLKRPIK